MRIEIRFQSPEDPQLGPDGEEAERLAFPDGQFASQIEYRGRKWTFHSTELIRGPRDTEPKVKRLVYVERKPRE